MKKLTVAAVIISTFVFYSFLHAQSGDALLAPRTLADAGTAPATSQPTTAAGPGSADRSAVPTVVQTQPPATEPPAAPTNPPAPAPTSTTALPTPTPRPAQPVSGKFKDGTYTGTVADAQWGYVQVQAVISQGRLTSVRFLEYPSDRSRSVFINRIADPELISEAIQAQS